MSLDTEMSQIVSIVPECLAAGYVDLTTGMLLAIKTVDSHPTEIMDILAAATADLFQGPNVQMIEKMFKKARGLQEDEHHYFQEMIINSDNLVHIFMRNKANEDQVLGVCCKRSVNLGMALTKVRAAMESVAKAA